MSLEPALAAEPSAGDAGDGSPETRSRPRAGVREEDQPGRDNDPGRYQDQTDDGQSRVLAFSHGLIVVFVRKYETKVRPPCSPSPGAQNIGRRIASDFELHDLVGKVPAHQVEIPVAALTSLGITAHARIVPIGYASSSCCAARSAPVSVGTSQSSRV